MGYSSLSREKIVAKAVGETSSEKFFVMIAASAVDSGNGRRSN